MSFPSLATRGILEKLRSRTPTPTPPTSDGGKLGILERLRSHTTTPTPVPVAAASRSHPVLNDDDASDTDSLDGADTDSLDSFYVASPAAADDADKGADLKQQLADAESIIEKLRSELRETESRLNGNISGLSTRLAEQTDQVEDISAKEESWRQVREHLVESLRVAREESSNNATELESMRTVVEELATQKSSLEQKNVELASENGSLRSQLDTVKSERDNARAELTDTTHKLTEAQTRKSMLESSLASQATEVARVKASEQALSAELAKARGALDTVKGHKKRLGKEIYSLRDTVVKLEASLAEERSLVEDLKASESSLTLEVSSQRAKIDHLEEVAVHRDRLRHEVRHLHEDVDRREGELESLVAVVDALKSSLANASHKMLKDRTRAPRTTDLERIVFSNKIIRTGIIPEIRSTFGIPEPPTTKRPAPPQRSSTLPRPPVAGGHGGSGSGRPASRFRRAFSHSRTASSPSTLKAKRRVKSSDVTVLPHPHPHPPPVYDGTPSSGGSSSGGFNSHPAPQGSNKELLSRTVSQSPSFSSSSMSSASSSASSVDFEAASIHHEGSGSSGHRRSTSARANNSSDGHRATVTHVSPPSSRSSSQAAAAAAPSTKRRTSDDFSRMNVRRSESGSNGVGIGISGSSSAGERVPANANRDRRDSLEQELTDFPSTVSLSAAPSAMSDADRLLGAVRRQFSDLLMQNALLRVKLNSVVQRVIVSDSGARIGRS